MKEAPHGIKIIYSFEEDLRGRVSSFKDIFLLCCFQHMKDELLTHGDYNVILVDWGGGSSIPYTQATANTRVVGAVIAKLIEALQVAAPS